ncbi:hypothetical protein IU414_06320 [Nocardia farcinica]|uniref:hypothetical protein n=1 Tax=Nocardia farcinica TaxID=37329 RepID=UPI0018953882|nr:hypothetical protein [Nocardia farcinica]MBF6584373.1 hypothetical protein [Nocardia farcinica]
MTEAPLPLPKGWPDGPLDEVLGELLAAAFREHCPDEACADVSSPAWAALDGHFDLRTIGAAIVPYMAQLAESSPLRADSAPRSGAACPDPLDGDAGGSGHASNLP